MPDLSRIQERIARHRPVEADATQVDMVAAVALILRQPPGAPPELLFIERAVRNGDPWSGQMAFPGGRRQVTDPDLEATAVRETLEEVGLRLGPAIGRLDDMTGNRGAPLGLLVAPFVYLLEERPRIRPNHEVRSVVWIPLRWILSPESAGEYVFEHPAFHGRFPAFHYGGHTVWGLTYRITGSFLGVIGRALPSYEGRREGEQEPD